MKKTKPVSEVYYEFEDELKSFLIENYDEDLRIENLPKRSYDIIVKETHKIVYEKYKNYIIYRDIQWYKIFSELDGLPKDYKSIMEKENNYLNVECILPRTIYNIEDTNLSGEIKEEVIKLL